MRFINFSGALPSPHIFSVPASDTVAQRFGQISLRRITGIYPTSVKEDQAFHNVGISTSDTNNHFFVPTRFEYIPQTIKELLLSTGLRSYRSSVLALHAPHIEAEATYSCMLAIRAGTPVTGNKTNNLRLINHAKYMQQGARLVPSSDPARYQQLTITPAGALATFGNAVPMSGFSGISASSYPIVYSTGISQALAGSSQFNSENSLVLWIYRAGVYSYTQNAVAPSFEEIAEAGGGQSAFVQAQYTASEPNETVQSIDQRFYSLDMDDQDTLHPVEFETYIYKKIRLIKFGSPLKIFQTAM